MKQHQADCPFARRVILDTGWGPFPTCICGPCDHPPEWRRAGIWPPGTSDTFCNFCKTAIPATLPDTPEVSP